MTGEMEAYLLAKVKSNLIIDHCRDDSLIREKIAAAVVYAEQHQNRQPGSYTTMPGSTSDTASGTAMTATTELAVIMLASHLYESRDGSTGGFFADNVQAEGQCWVTVNRLLDMDKDWKV